MENPGSLRKPRARHARMHTSFFCGRLQGTGHRRGAAANRKTWGLFQRMSVIKSALSSGFGSTLGPGRGGGACFGLAYVADSLTVLAALRALGPVRTGLGPLEQTQNKSIEACNLQSQRVPANLLRVGSELSYQYFSQQYIYISNIIRAYANYLL